MSRRVTYGTSEWAARWMVWLVVDIIRRRSRCRHAQWQARGTCSLLCAIDAAVLYALVRLPVARKRPPLSCSVTAGGANSLMAGSPVNYVNFEELITRGGSKDVTATRALVNVDIIQQIGKQISASPYHDVQPMQSSPMQSSPAIGRHHQRGVSATLLWILLSAARMV
ncbi:hypothetical protein BD310DRAFT_182460 [Dichomitus squalens]|uniref:Uncharacterized protein n=1 Tax=Dichomitus squalens TaxID=114155 RepID=A0A4Q9PHF3_9APHY|nr:hypothetical protein BD310DRAFT_182460 [Dichomitus squalens]